jgi:hypothetical protein
MHACKRQWLIASYDIMLYVHIKIMGYYYMSYSLRSRNLCLLFDFESNSFINDLWNHV